MTAETIYALLTDTGRQWTFEDGQTIAAWNRYRATLDLSYPQRQRAHSRFRFQVRKGRVHRLTSCQMCGQSPSKICAHHYNGYDDEHALDVVYLCVGCHATAHFGTPNRSMKKKRAAGMILTRPPGPRPRFR